MNKLNQVLGKNGNMKIPKSTAIFNMASATECPSRLKGICSAVLQGAKCYALKSELPYRPDVLPYRTSQMKYWLRTDADTFIAEFIAINARKRNKFTALRLNESGDFHSQACVDKAEKIATALKANGVTTYVYTSRKDLDFSDIKTLIVNGSNFQKKGVVNIVSIFKGEVPKGYIVCPGSCKSCSLCQKKGVKIAIEKH